MDIRARLPVIALALLLTATFRMSGQSGEEAADTSGVIVLDSIARAIGTIDDDAISESTILRRADSVAVQPLSVHDGFIDDYRRQDRFDYEHPRDPHSLWDRFREWLWDLIESILPRGVANDVLSFLMAWLPYIVLAGGAGVAAWKLYRARPGGLIGRSDRALVSDMAAIEENLDAADLDMLINQAVAEGRYRRATRLLYLRSLRDLSERNLIEYRRERTNAEYARELRNDPIGPLFERITLLFEYVWYGDLQIDGERYPVVADAFDQFRVRLREERL